MAAECKSMRKRKELSGLEGTLERVGLELRAKSVRAGFRQLEGESSRQ